MTLYCERCGKAYESYDGSRYYAVLSSPDCKNNAIMLCPDCSEEVRVWMEKGVNNGNT